MKKTWKECLYDFCTFCDNYLIPAILGVMSVVCCIISIFLNETDILCQILTYAFCFLFMLAVGGMLLCVSVTHYNKETFLHNKLFVLLLAKNEFFIFVIAIIYAIGIILSGILLFAEEFSKLGIVLYSLTIVLLLVAIYMMAERISKHFKKQVVQIGKKKE